MVSYLCLRPWQFSPQFHRFSIWLIHNLFIERKVYVSCCWIHHFAVENEKNAIVDNFSSHAMSMFFHHFEEIARLVVLLIFFYSTLYFTLAFPHSVINEITLTPWRQFFSQFPSTLCFFSMFLLFDYKTFIYRPCASTIYGLKRWKKVATSKILFATHYPSITFFHLRNANLIWGPLEHIFEKFLKNTNRHIRATYHRRTKWIFEIWKWLCQSRDVNKISCVFSLSDDNETQTFCYYMQHTRWMCAPALETWASVLEQ